MLRAEEKVQAGKKSIECHFKSTPWWEKMPGDTGADGGGVWFRWGLRHSRSLCGSASSQGRVAECAHSPLVTCRVLSIFSKCW